MSNITNKIFTEKLGGRSASQYIGNPGDIFYDATAGGLRIGDGLHPGGTQIGLELNESAIAAAKASYESSLGSWAAFASNMRDVDAASESVTEQGWPFINWNVNGETAAGYLQQLVQAWQVQNTPSSPPSALIFNPPISASLYNEFRAVLQYIQGQYESYLAALGAKQISGVSLTVPELVQTTPEEDLVIRTRTAVPSSPPGSTLYTNRDFTFGVNGTLTFPNGTVQTGAAIDKAYLQFIVASSTDFDAFKAAIAAL